MYSYYNILNSLKDTFDSDSRVHTIVTGDTQDIDNFRKNIFPLVHIHFNDSPFAGENTTALVRYSVEITVVDIRDINKETVNDKFWTNDNRHDNWNETRSILKLAENKYIKEKDDICLQSAGAANMLTFHFENALDGWQQTFTFDVPDLYTTICNG